MCLHRVPDVVAALSRDDAERPADSTAGRRPDADGPTRPPANEVDPLCAVGAP